MSKKDKLSKLDKYLLEIRWKDIYINEEESDYQISNTGLILNKVTNKLLTPYKLPTGYLDAQLHMAKKIYHRLVHRLVAVAFIDNPDPVNKIQVNHIDGDKTNNHVDNLEWATREENMHHAVDVGLLDNTGMNNPNNKYTVDRIHLVCKLLEKGMGPTAISKVTSVDSSTVDKIKSKRQWREISNDYSILPPGIKPHIIIPDSYIEYIIELFDIGITNYKELLLNLGLPDTQENMEYLSIIDLSLKSKVEGSTTIDQSLVA